MSDDEDDAAAVASEDDENVGNEDEDRLPPNLEGGGDSDEEYTPAVPWNSPEGFEAYLGCREAFLKEIGCVGRGCAVCGERKQKGAVVTAHDLLHKFYSAPSKEELLQMLYPEFPKKELESQACIRPEISLCYRMNSGHALDASMKAESGRSGLQRASSRKSIF